MHRLAINNTEASDGMRCFPTFNTYKRGKSIYLPQFLLSLLKGSFGGEVTDTEEMYGSFTPSFMVANYKAEMH